MIISLMDLTMDARIRRQIDFLSGTYDVSLRPSGGRSTYQVSGS